VCVGAVDVARAALVDAEGDERVGEYEGHQADGQRLVTHYFTCLDRGYRGWRWAVTVARASRSRHATVAEIVLLPGADALLAPAWVPWDRRIRPGDLGVGDLLPTDDDDARLAPGFTAADTDLPEWGDPLAPPAWELGLGRSRVLSGLGRDEAAERWYAGDGGPRSPLAQAAPARCSTCGFLVPLAGSLRRTFGACAHPLSPSDGRVVSLDHGCGAHSEAAVVPAPTPVAERVLDEVAFDVVTVSPEQETGSIDAAAPAEELGHS
jgi:hypothetical protein